MTNAAEHYERTNFDLYKDDICLVLTLTHVLMDNILHKKAMFLSFYKIYMRLKHMLSYISNTYNIQISV